MPDNVNDDPGLPGGQPVPPPWPNPPQAPYPPPQYGPPPGYGPEPGPPAGPGYGPGPGYGAPAGSGQPPGWAGPPGPGAAPGAAPPSPARNRWLLGGSLAAAVVIIVVAVAVVLATRHPSRPAAAGPAGHPSAPAASSAPARGGPEQAVSPASQVTGTVTDTAARLSWPKLGGSWTLQPQHPGRDFTQFMALTTATFTYQGKPTPWAATVASGVLGPDAKVGYTGPASLPQAATAFINNVVIPKEYFPGSTLAVDSRKSLTVSGKPAYLVRFTVSYKYAGLSSTQDSDVIVLVAAGSGPPSVFQVGIPDNTGTLIADLTLELNSLRVTG
jgi:hypothetical protein